jgi:pyruvate,orthophosphate dikinase
MTFGLSRDDVGRFLPTYIKNNLYENDPFQTIDEAGVGKLIKMSSDAGKDCAQETAHGKKTLFKTGVCGEHGGDPASVKFFHRIGLDYVSCSPFRVPLARLASAQAVIEEESKATKK